MFVLLGALIVISVWYGLTFLISLARWIAMPLLFLTALFLIVLVLIQRGKGGGLAGAFGGMGGQSAFGTKAGDLFTKITIGVAAFWILLCIVTVKEMKPPDLIESDLGSKGADKGGVSAPLSTDSDEPGGAAPQPAGPADSGGDES
jgi:preprotein translocase subunit SecG